MEDFCGGEFWDSDNIWNTTDPYFQPCFEKTVLVWVPVGFLIVFCPIDFYMSISSKKLHIPLSILAVLKFIANFLLIISQVILLAKHVQDDEDDNPFKTVDIYENIFRLISYFLIGMLLLISRKKGIQSSPIHFLFWFLSFICHTIIFRTLIRKRYEVHFDNEEYLHFYARTMSYILVVISFLLNIRADKEPYGESEKNLNKSPEGSASFLSKLLFFWYDNLAWKGFRQPLKESELYDLDDDMKAKVIYPVFHKHWNKKKKQKKGNKTTNEEPKKYQSIVPVLAKSLGMSFITGCIFKLVPDLIAFVSPQILEEIIKFVGDPSIETWKGYLFGGVLFCSGILSSIFNTQYAHKMYLAGFRVRSGLTQMIYRKALKISNASKKDTTVGEIVNLMAVDIQRFVDLAPFINLVWSAPLQIAISLYFLYVQLGAAIFAGLGVMFLLIPINTVVGAKSRKFQIIQMKLKDQRVKLMNEILGGVKVLKLYAWEKSFSEQIEAIRSEEMKVLRKTAILSAITNFFFACAPALVATVSFLTYVLIDEENILDASKAFVSLSLFNILNLPMTMLPMAIVFLVQASVSVKRLNKFLNSEELDESLIGHDKNEKDDVIAENASFSWEKGKKVLKNINLNIKPGSLVAVVGVVGSGKSSLLASILGELNKESGRVNTKGRIAYVSQQAWIQNATLRDNILFGKDFESGRYEKVIEACCLKPDLDILPGRDQTEIGEKGINLSGGQKQRISMARAVYNQADLYLLDDPLSAVDSHVGKSMFENVIGDSGLLKGKTRILVTHGISFLPEVDKIIVLKDGEIDEIGTFYELLHKKGGAFAEFLKTHLTSLEEAIDDKSILEELSSAEEDIIGLTRGLVLAREESLRRKNLKNAKELKKQESKIENVEDVNKLIEIEKAETKSVKATVYLDYFRAAGIVSIFLAFVFFCLYQGAVVGGNIWLSDWTSNPDNTIDKKDLYLGIYSMFGVLQAIFLLFGIIILSLGLLSSSNVLHHNMLERILKAPMSFFDSTPIGRIVNRFSKDIDVVDNILPLFMRFFAIGFFQVIGIMVMISYSTPIILSVMIPISVVYYFIQRIYIAVSRQLKRIESITRSPIYSHFGETISGATTIRAFRMSNSFIKDSEQKLDINQMSYWPALLSNRWLSIRLEFIGNTIVLFASIFVVLSRTSIDPGLAGLSVTYALQITLSLNVLVRFSSDVETNIVAVERLKEYAEVAQEAEYEINENKPDKSWPQKGQVLFENYSTRYRTGLDLVVKKINCSIHPAEKVGIVGRTGAGKSSLTLALFRLIEPADGKILIDNIDVSKLGLYDLRRGLTIIPQDPILFSGTLRINLDPFSQHSDDQVWRALELAHLKAFVIDQEKSLQFEIQEGGENLSVGQRQLLGLARALLRKTKIIILDEATAAVDLDTDDLIQKTIREEFKDSTVITIAHRLNTIIDSDRVLVLDKGEIKEFESPQSLLKKTDSIFYSMARDAGLV